MINGTRTQLRFYYIQAINVIQIPSLLLYLVFLYVLICNRNQLRSSFYRICISVGVADLMYMIVSMGHQLVVYVFDCKHWSDTSKQAYLLGVKIGGWNCSYFSQMMGVLILTFNRFTAIMFPMRHEIFWGRRFTLPIAIISQWIPSIVYAPYLLWHPRMKLEPRNRTKWGWWVPKEGTASVLSVLVPSLFMISAAIIGMYALMFARIMLHRRKINVIGLANDYDVQERKNEKRRERKLAFVSAVLGASVVYYAVSNAVRLLEKKANTPYWIRKLLTGFGGRLTLAMYVSPFADLVFTFSNPYLILLTSTECRLLLWGLFPMWFRSLFKKSSKKAHTVTRVTVPNGDG